MSDETPDQTALEQQTNGHTKEPLENTNKSGEKPPFMSKANSYIELPALNEVDGFSEGQVEDRLATIGTRLAMINGRDGHQESAHTIWLNVVQNWHKPRIDKKKGALRAILGHLQSSRDLQKAVDGSAENPVVIQDEQEGVASASADQTAERDTAAAGWGGGDDGFFERFEEVHHRGDNDEEDDTGEEVEDGV